MLRGLHVTRAADLPQITASGILPAIGPRSFQLGETISQSYHFVLDVDVLSDALSNWLGDAFEEAEPLALLMVDLTDMDATPSFQFESELTTSRAVTPDRIVVLAPDLDVFFQQDPATISAALQAAIVDLQRVAAARLVPVSSDDDRDVSMTDNLTRERAQVAALRFFTSNSDFNDAQFLAHWGELSGREEPDTVAPFLLYEPIEQFSPASFIQVVEDAAACIERVSLAHPNEPGQAALISALRICCSEDLTDDQFVKHWAGWLNHTIGAKPVLTRWAPFEAYSEDEFAELILDTSDFLRVEMSRPRIGIDSLVNSPIQEPMMANSQELSDQPLSLGGMTLRPDLAGRFIAREGQDFSDAEIARVFDGAVLEEYCVNSFKRARDLGLTMADVERLNRSEEVHLVVRFNTDNAAFADGIRTIESARILHSAAARVEDVVLMGRDAEVLLRDINGNTVGKMFNDREQPQGARDNQVMVGIHLSGASFNDDPHNVVREVLTGAANRIALGETDFVLRDINGNTLGRAVFNAPASLANDGQVNMAIALAERRVFLIEESFDSINDGAHRFAVTVGDFEVGYGQGQGEVHVVNAEGDVLTTETVRESGLIALSREQKDQLVAVAEGRMTLEAHENHYSDHDGLSL